MTSNRNNDNTEVKRYIEIDGQQIPVSEEVYRAYKQPLWAEHKRKERKKRCVISGGKSGTKRCDGDCSKCGRQRTGGILSLDKLAEDGFDAADSVSVAELVEDKLELELLTAALEKLDPDERSLIDALFYKDRTVRDYAAEIGVSHQAVVKRKQKVIEKLRSIMGAK